MASLGNDIIRQAIQNTAGVAAAIRQAQAGQPTTFNLPMPKYNGEQMQAKSGSSTPTGEHRNAEQFNPASAVPRVVDKVRELDLPGRTYSNNSDRDIWSHVPGTRPELPDQPFWRHENERRRAKAAEQYNNHILYNLINAPKNLKETGTLPRSYLTPYAQKYILPDDFPYDGRITPEQWAKGQALDNKFWIGGGRD